MALSLDEVSIRCMGCSVAKTLDQAIRDGWKMCKSCNFAICSLCYENLGPSPKCISYLCSPHNRDLDPIPLPTEKILVFAQEHSYQDYQKGLLYKLFYEDEELGKAPVFFVVREKQKQAPSLENKPTKLQEEVWKNFQLVITKRRGGKFITWERIL